MAYKPGFAVAALITASLLFIPVIGIAPKGTSLILALWGSVGVAGMVAHGRGRLGFTATILYSGLLVMAWCWLSLFWTEDRGQSLKALVLFDGHCTIFPACAEFQC